MRPLAVHLAWFDEARECFTSRSLLVGERAVVNGVAVRLDVVRRDGIVYPQIVFGRAEEAQS